MSDHLKDFDGPNLTATCSCWRDIIEFMPAKVPHFLKIGDVASYIVGIHADDYGYTASAYEISGWTDEDNGGEQVSLTHHLDALIKWDGCSHFNVGDTATTGSEGYNGFDGYLHLCGPEDIYSHLCLVSALWKAAREHFPESHQIEDHAALDALDLPAYLEPAPTHLVFHDEETGSLINFDQ